MLNRSRVLNDLIVKDGNKCMLCGKIFNDINEISIDHILPASLGYGDHNNLQLVCNKCNVQKSNKQYYFSEHQLEEFLEELISMCGEYRDICTGSSYTIGSNTQTQVDLFFTRKIDNKRIIAEVKSNTTYTKMRIIEIINRMSAYQNINRKAELLLIIPGTLPDYYRTMLNEAGIKLWDRNYIANNFKNEIAKLEHPIFSHVFSTSRIEKSSELNELIEELKKCPYGTQGWQTYQRLIGRIVRSLFCPPLHKPIEEHFDSNKLNRKDFVVPNYATDGFWKFIRERYYADYIVVDAKNSGNKIRKKDVLQISNYLKIQGTGLFAILFSRNGFAPNTYYTLSELWGLQQKLIIVLDDNDVIQMLMEKIDGGNPESVVQKKIEDFRLSI